MESGAISTGMDTVRVPLEAIKPTQAKELLVEMIGNEEMDGHGATVTARWSAWRLMGSPAGDWLMKPREDVYGKSRWDSTRDCAEFICWLMDYTGRDVIYSEGESTGWGGHVNLHRCPPGMPEQPASVEERHKKYAEANMYEVYPSYMCYTGLRCAAQMADAAGESETAARWRSYSERIAKAMVAELVIKDGDRDVWHCTPSVFPSKQESLAPAWAAIYVDGLDPKKWHPEIGRVTHNTLNQHIESKPGCAQPLAMGYGQGWLTHAALAVDEMDSAGECLINIAKYSYDKNMDYVDEGRGIDWRKWLYIVPEGTHPMQDGRWYRTGDLSNGANQGPAMHALEVCAGIDDTNPEEIKIMPRVPDPLTGLEVSNFLTVIADGDRTQIARVNYTYEKGKSFSLTSDKPLPNLAVRLGPYVSEGAARRAIQPSDLPSGATGRLERSGRYQDSDAWWIWVETEKAMDAFELDLAM